MTIDCDIRREVDVIRSIRVQQLEGIFDVAPSQRSERVWHHQFTLPENWNIGVIVGPSGCGKTTLARQVFGNKLVERFDWPVDKSILDGFPAHLGIREITGLLCSVGFSSPPAWVRPFSVLSNGEQFRVTLARTLAELSQRNPGAPGMSELAVMDEFSSVVDRTAACIGSAAVSKAVRRRGQKFVAVTCHYDVLDWLQPDWVYEPHTAKTMLHTAAPAAARGSLRRRPPIELEIIRVHHKMWQLFAPHHYLSTGLHIASKCFLALARIDAGNFHPAAFVAALPFPHRRPTWREHRCVCLPDYQGVGIGNAVSEFVADRYVKAGNCYFSTTSHPGMIRHRTLSPLWRLRRRPSFTRRHRGLGDKWIGSVDRLTAGFEYVGNCTNTGVETKDP